MSHAILHEDISMTREKDPVRILAAVIVYVVIFVAAQLALDWLLATTGTPAGVATRLAGALIANWLALRMFEDRGLGAIGMAANRMAVDNAAIGIAGGMGAARQSSGIRGHPGCDRDAGRRLSG